MKKLILTFFGLFVLLAVTDAQAQTAQDNSKSKDEFWGTPKTNRGVSADAVGARAEALDTRYNAYETSRRGSFRLMNYNDKRLTEMQKKEEKLLKKHKREKKKQARKNRKN